MSVIASKLQIFLLTQKIPKVYFRFFGKILSKRPAAQPKNIKTKPIQKKYHLFNIPFSNEYFITSKVKHTDKTRTK